MICSAYIFTCCFPYCFMFGNKWHGSDLTSSLMHFLPACFCTDTRLCIQDIKIVPELMKSYSVCTHKAEPFLELSHLFHICPCSDLSRFRRYSSFMICDGF